jgi:hypothetical protein
VEVVVLVTRSDPPEELAELDADVDEEEAGIDVEVDVELVSVTVTVTVWEVLCDALTELPAPVVTCPAGGRRT